MGIGSVIGLVTVLGLATRHLLLTMGQLQSAVRDGRDFGPELVQDVMRERTGSILTSTLVVGLGFLPMVFFGSIAGLEILSPMALVVLGGLVTSTLTNLYAVPALYMQFGRGAVPEWNSDVDESADDAEGLHYAKG